ncbi:MAG: DNA gyrase subunit A [Synergistaceae bacterium]|nr:DNA gyrase subunit A [Synergistaceae bacterium]
MPDEITNSTIQNEDLKPQGDEKILTLPLVGEIKTSYLNYAMSVIVGRALPDARDGLKPVQRRVLYAMSELGLKHNTAYKKSARIVGETMGKYHPHGDSAIYDTMVRLAQNWNLRYTLVDGQGNFGSVDGDSPAAMRYTEARLSRPGELMLANLDEDTVEWGQNFDESLKEPLTLPSIFPNLLVNGSTGIAVGMATNMPPHNLREVVNVFCWLIDNNIEPEDAELNDIMNIMPAPDFPTGGEILGRSGIIEAYSTGRGKITVRGKLHTEESKRGRQSIVITEIPYGVNKTIMLEAMVEAVQNKDIEGVHEMRDESDRDGLRIVIELSRDADSDLITRQLYKHTSLQSTFGVINLALVNGHPEILSLKQLLSIFLNYRRDVVRRRTEHRMKQAKAREHIIEGLKKALTHIEQVIRTIRSTDNAAEAKASLQSVLEFSEAQAQAILDMRLQRLTGLERNKLDDEQSKLLADIAAYTSILEDRKVLDGVIRAELVDLAERFGDDRRTSLSEEPAPETEDYDLIPEEDIIITLSKDGLIKRQPLQSYRLQATGGKGKRGASIHEDDSIEILCVTTTHKDIYFFTNTGRIMSIKGYEIPETRSGKGKPVSRYLPLNLEAGERIVNIAGAGDGDFKYAFFITRMGIAKRMSFDELKYTNRAKRIMKLDAGDEIAQVMLTTGNNDVVMVTRNGLALRVSENEFRPLSRTARGVQAIRLKNDDRVLSCDVVDDSRTILVISQFGIGKRVEFSSFMPHHRATTGICLMELTEKTGKLSASLSVKSTDEIIAISSKGRMIRMPVKGINIMKRHSVGVIIIRLDEGDSVADCSFISAEEEDGELTAELPFGDAAEGGDE